MPRAGTLQRRFDDLNRRIVACARCPRLRRYCARVARRKRAAYRQQIYHGRPVPNFGAPVGGSPAPWRVLIVGLAPGAHGANRTGRMFTGDRSGDFLFAALHATGFANQPLATHAGDGLELIDCVITAACHCAPPGNQPTPLEMARCAPWLDATAALLPDLCAVVCLGRIAFDAVLRLHERRGWLPAGARRASRRFAHGAEHRFPAAPVVLCSYHPSQQNTFTGRLTQAMLRQVFRRARELARDR